MDVFEDVVFSFSAWFVWTECCFVVCGSRFVYRSLKGVLVFIVVVFGFCDVVLVCLNSVSSE